jgi:CheY-like chemotaxis protein
MQSFSNSIEPVLLVEDNPDDVFFMERAVKKANLPIELHLARDGQEAVDYLLGAGRFADREQHPLPSLIFLDLKLPYFSGFDVLTRLEGRPDLRQIPVIILTSSDEERDRKMAAEFGVADYLIKPPDALMLQQSMEKLRGLKT